MEFEKIETIVEDIRPYDFEESEDIVTLSSSAGNFPLMAAFTVYKNDLPKDLAQNDIMFVYLQAMTGQKGRFEVYKDEASFYKKHPKVDVESFFPEWEENENGVRFVEFGNINGRVVEVEDFDPDQWWVKLKCNGYFFSTLVLKNMPGLSKRKDHAAATEIADIFHDIDPSIMCAGSEDYSNYNPVEVGDIISGEFLLTFDLVSPS